MSDKKKIQLFNWTDADYDYRDFGGTYYVLFYTPVPKYRDYLVKKMEAGVDDLYMHTLMVARLREIPKCFTISRSCNLGGKEEEIFKQAERWYDSWQESLAIAKQCKEVPAVGRRGRAL